MRPSNNLENKTISDTYKAHSSLEPPLECNQDHRSLMNQFVMTFLAVLGVTIHLGRNIMQFLIRVVKGKIGKEIPESSRLEFLEKFLANNFALSDAEDNISRPLNRGGVADSPFLRTLLAISQNSRQPSFWEVIDSFVSVSYASLATSTTLLQGLLACLNFTLDSEDLFYWYKWKKWFLWTMRAVQAAENHGDEWGLRDEGYIHQF